MIERNSLWFSQTLNLTVQVYEVGEKNILYLFGDDEYGIISLKMFKKCFKKLHEKS